MKPNEPSGTALMIARQRAAHQVLDKGPILCDPFAMKILGEGEKHVLQFANKHPLASIGRLFTTARSRIAEDALAKAVETGVRQIVVLGAGLDTFALRKPHAARKIRVYEVDHPATQAWKRRVRLISPLLQSNSSKLQPQQFSVFVTGAFSSFTSDLGPAADFNFRQYSIDMFGRPTNMKYR